MQVELLHPVCVQFTPFIADYGNLSPHPKFELRYQFDHVGERIRMLEHEVPKLTTREWSPLVEYYEIQILIQCDPYLLVDLEGKVMTILH